MFASGIVNTGTAAGNAEAAVQATIAAITAHPGYTFIERVAGSGGVTTDVIKSSGLVNGDADWYLLIRHNAAGVVHWAVAEFYDSVTKLVNKYVPGPASANSADDGFTNGAGVSLATAVWGTVANAINSALVQNHSTTPHNWWVITTNKYVNMGGYYFGALEVPVGSRWRRNLIQGSVLVATAKSTVCHGLRSAYGHSTGILNQFVATPFMSQVTTQAGGGWAAGGYDVNLGKYPYTKIPVIAQPSTTHFVGFLMDILWLPYVPALHDTAQIDGEEYRYVGGYCWHRTAAV